MTEWILLFVVCYAMGSIPTAYLLGKWLHGIDIRKVGYRNAGVANAWRQMSPRAGLLVLLIDAGKGMAAVTIARRMIPGDASVILAGFAAVAGHNWPAFLKFHGGRGAATAMGVLSFVLPYATLPLVAISLCTFWLTNRFLIVMLCLFVPLPFVAWYLHAPAHLVLFAFALPIIVLASHLLSEHFWPEKPAEGASEATTSV